MTKYCSFSFVIKLIGVSVLIYFSAVYGKIYIRDVLRTELVKNLQPYKVVAMDGDINLFRMGRDHDGGYVVPGIALSKADALLGYGIADDASFEESFSTQYRKPSYGFDCSTQSIESHNKLFTFLPECLGTDQYIYKNSSNNQKISSFKEQLLKFNLENKRLFIKMDIEGAEFETLPVILSHSANVTGIVLELHYGKQITKLWKAVKLLKELNKDFFLIHIHGNNYVAPEFSTKNISKGLLGNVIELSYINKSLVSQAEKMKEIGFPTPLDQPNCPTCQDYSYSLSFVDK